MKLVPLLYYFLQDPATVFALYLIYRQIIEAYLISIVLFVYFLMVLFLPPWAWKLLLLVLRLLFGGDSLVLTSLTSALYQTLHFLSWLPLACL